MFRDVTETVCAQQPEPFFAVGAWYRDFTQTSDEEVRTLLEEEPGTYFLTDFLVRGFDRIVMRPLGLGDELRAAPDENRDFACLIEDCRGLVDLIGVGNMAAFEPSVGDVMRHVAPSWMAM